MLLNIQNVKNHVVKMQRQERVSIIIPFKSLDDYARECIGKCLDLDYGNLELILLPDSPLMEKFKRSRIIPTGEVKPSLKRNIGVSKSRGRICAFIDSDAYPERDWIRNALRRFKGDVGIVGGPNILPENDSIWQRASDDILSSAVGAGPLSLRYKSGGQKTVKELPSCNLLIKKSLFQRAGGFDTSVLTAEDSKLCFQVSRLGKLIVYSPDVVVYHHRKPLFMPHFRQMWTYGRDKAFILKRFFSADKLYYFLPSLFVLFLIFGFLLSFNPFFEITYLRSIYLGLVAFYTIVILAASILKNPRRSVLVFPGIILTHISYGLGFLYGLFRRDG